MNAPALLCAHCDYDLRTLDRAGVCPECAMPIAKSVAAAAEPLHGVRRPLRLAATVLLAAMALRLAFAVGLVIFHVRRGSSPDVFAFVMSLVLTPWPLDELLSLVANMSRTPVTIRVLSSVMVLSFAALCAGVWLITRPWAGLVGWPLLRHATRWAVIGIVAIGVMLLWPPTDSLLGFLRYALFTAGGVIGPALLIAAWTGRVWWRTFRIARRPRSAVLAWSAILATGVASVVHFVRPGMNPKAWLAAAVSGLALLLLSWMWLDLWRLTARRAEPAPVATMH
jgi:hypothetical protein